MAKKVDIPHKLDRVSFDKKEKALKDLKEDTTKPTTIAALRVRVDNIERFIGVGK